MNFDSFLMFKNFPNNVKNYTMVILLGLIPISCLYSLNSSNGIDFKGNNISASMSDNAIDSLGNINDSELKIMYQYIGVLKNPTNLVM